ncbi:hypothetical protein [Bacillus atrophaeus]|uniref:hypothetical protein n=1 Tax=Bacillus atrophaeus TaxID=1452 RepID=UPI002E1FF118|nr:hypothetical protein [Bacillus atrophaeus]
MYITIGDFSEIHAHVRVEKKGRQWETVWKKEFDEEGNMTSPTVEQVRDAFIEDPSSFRMR